MWWILLTARALEIAPELSTSGWNNQRESVVAGAVFARAMNRTLVLPTRFNPSTQDHFAFEVASVIDIPRLQEYVPVMLDDELYEEMRRGLRVEFDVHCPGLTEVQIRRAGQRPERLLLNVGYVYEDVVFKSNAAFSSALSTNVYKYLRPHPAYYECALKVVAAIDAKISVHLRVGTRIKPAPLMDCEAHGYTTVNHDDVHCEDEDGRIVSMADLIRGDSTIYVATNDVHHPHTVDFLRRMPKAYTYANISSLVQSECRGVDDVSVLEQAICAVTDVYYATFYSSWDEWVLHLRQRMSLHDDSALALFILKSQARSLRHMRYSYQTECEHTDFATVEDGVLAASCLCSDMVDTSLHRSTYRLKDPVYGHLQRYHGGDAGEPASRLPVTFSSSNLLVDED